MKRILNTRGFLVGCLILATLLVPLQLAYSADVTIYDNMTGYNPTWYAFDQAYWYLYTTGAIVKQEVAHGFSTGNFSGTLSSVVLPLNSPGGTPWVGLYADDGGKPNGLLGELRPVSGNIGYGCQTDYNNCTFGNVTYGGSGISLAPNTTYWVVLAVQRTQYEFCTGQPCGGTIFWAQINDTTSPRSLFYQIDGDRVLDWSVSASHYVQLMQVYGTTGPTTLQPIANAGANATAHEGSTVTLDGSSSSDPSGLPLAYLWAIVSAPEGSSATLSDPTAVGPGFTVDKAGDYIVRLVVTNSEGVVSAPATVTISTYNAAPMADPGPDQAIVRIGSTVLLDGSHSYDADGDPITYSWTLMSKPVSSAANLNGGTTAGPTFVADVQGTYVIQLVVSDPWVASPPKTVTVSFDNVKPVANAGTGQLATVGDLVSVDGSGSSDANSDPLTYHWSFATMPSNSVARLADPTAVQPTFVPDQSGTYGLQLIVNDGSIDSDPSTVQVQVTAVLSNPLIALVSEEIRLIGLLDPFVFRNSNLQNSLINKLQAVVSAIQSDDYEDAVRKLQTDVMGKTDGCAASGAPDKNDWIGTCDAQKQVYADLMNIIERMMELVRH